MLESIRISLLELLLRMTTQRWQIILPFLGALSVLFYIGWTAVEAFVYPYDGIITVELNGLVKEVDPSGPAHGHIEVNDLILFANGRTLSDALPLEKNMHVGDLATFKISRGGQTLSSSFYLQEPPLNEIVSRLTTLMIALIFLGLGVGVQAFRQSDEAQDIFYLFFLCTSVLLTSAVNTYIGPAWASTIYSFSLWMIGPLAVHFHLYFPQQSRVPGRRLWLPILYFVAILGSLPHLFLGPQAINAASWVNQITFASRIYLALCFTIVVWLLFYSYRTAASPGVRSKIRLVVLGGMLSLLPLVVLIILPFALMGEFLIPFELVFLFLSILPLTYGFAIFRHRLIEIERHINRGATYILVYSVLGGIYLVLYIALHSLIPYSLIQEPLLNTILVLGLASIIVPLYRIVQRIVDIVFYGGWYDYRSAVTELTQGLEQTTDLQTLADLTSERLVKTFRLEEACVFLSDINKDYSVISVAPKPLLNDTTQRLYAPLPRSSLNYLLRVGGAVERTVLRKTLSELALSREEAQLLNSEQAHLWVPVIGHGQVLGLLALGPKFGGDIFSGEDLDILRVLARQISPIIENLHLVTRLRRHAEDLEHRVNERTAELHSAKGRLEAILASVGEGVFVTNLQGIIMTANETYQEQTGFSLSELLGQKMDWLYALEPEDHVIEEYTNALTQERVWNGEYIGLKKDKSCYDVLLTMTPLRDENGEFVGYVGSQRDITRQKELDRLKDLFVSDVSHELRTPTTNIGLYLDLLEAAPKEKQAKYLAVLKDQTLLLMKLVEDILDLSRLSVGKGKQTEFTEVDINTLAEQVIVANSPRAVSKGLELKFYSQQDSSIVLGEPAQISRVINNLVSNAIQYTSQGEVRVSTSSLNGCVCLDVKDTGMGIDPEDIPHIFERFYRGRHVRQTKIHGTGLGLAIVKEIMEIHGGNIEIETVQGKGSTFRVHFPRYEGS